MAHHAVAHNQVSIRLSGKTFSISETCYRYQAKLSDENAEIADWLLRLSYMHKR
jgi:putative transposase